MVKHEWVWGGCLVVESIRPIATIFLCKELLEGRGGGA